MTKFSGFDANQAIVDFLIDNDSTCLPQEARDWIRDAVAQSDGLTMIMRVMETLYEYRDVCPEGRELARDLANFVSERNFWGMGGMDGRATKVASVLDRVVKGRKNAKIDGDPERSEQAPPLPAPETEAPAVVAALPAVAPEPSTVPADDPAPADGEG